MRKSVEVWVYFSDEVIPSWSKCYNDEIKVEFKSKGHFVYLAGAVSATLIGGEGQDKRIIYIPSDECHDKGEDFVFEILGIVLDDSIDSVEKERRTDDVYNVACSRGTREHVDNIEDVSVPGVLYRDFYLDNKKTTFQTQAASERLQKNLNKIEAQYLSIRPANSKE